MARGARRARRLREEAGKVAARGGEREGGRRQREQGRWAAFLVSWTFWVKGSLKGVSDERWAYREAELCCLLSHGTTIRTASGRSAALNLESPDPGTVRIRLPYQAQELV